MTSSFTSEFRQEFEAERARWLRRRFLWYVGVVIALGVLTLLPILVVLFIPGAARASGESGERALQGVRATAWVQLVFSLVSLAIYVWAFVYVRRRLLDGRQTLRLTTWIIALSGFLAVIVLPVMTEIMQSALDQTDNNPQGVAYTGLAQIFTLHFFACLFLPWSPRESLRPVLPLLALNLLIAVIYAASVWSPLWVAVFSPVAVLPGLVICWWRQSRFREKFNYRMLRGRYQDMRRELVDARRIHESLFPQTVSDGPVRFDYRYEPMHQIGGDFLYSRFLPSPHGEQPRLSVVIIDVTGHGIPAALTVNRLHGELERLFAENPDASPGDILSSLNRYVHLTLAEHSVFVTALCVRIDPNINGEGSLEYASGGHPPAFIRTVDDRVEQLDSTAFVLGACAAQDFDPGQQAVRFGLGDTLIAYTDGATEARDTSGRMLRIDGMRRLVALATPERDGGLCGAVLRGVDKHRFGPIADDTLVVEISRPIAGVSAHQLLRKPVGSAGAAATPGA